MVFKRLISSLFSWIIYYAPYTIVPSYVSQEHESILCYRNTFALKPRGASLILPSLIPSFYK